MQKFKLYIEILYYKLLSIIYNYIIPLKFKYKFKIYCLKRFPEVTENNIKEPYFLNIFNSSNKKESI